MYTADFNYFNNIDSPEKAYWLGFIYADGYVSSAQRKKIFGISLSSKDADQLRKLNRCLNSNYDIKEYVVKNGYKPGTKYSRLIINSEQMYNDLINHGVYERKTSILRNPTIPREYDAPFILGYFDGDGSIFLNNGKYPFYSIDFVGTDSVLTYIHNYFMKEGCTKKSLYLEKRRQNQTVSYIRYGGNVLVETMLGILYQSVPNYLPLDRKRLLYEKCKNRIF